MENNNESLTPEVSRESEKNKGREMANKAANKAADKGKQLLKKAGKKGAAKGKLAAAAGPVIFWAVVIIVIIIILIGIIMFFATMPGMVMDKLKQIFKMLGNYLAAFFGADTTQQIDDKQIYQTLDYLEDMGYDLKGYGFLTDYYDLSDADDVKSIREDLSLDKKKPIKDALSEAGYKYDKKIGAIRDTDNHIELAESDFIFTYITSDNYVYTLKNTNVATQNEAKNIFEKAIAAITSFVTKLFAPLMDIIGATDGIVDTWGRGLIVAWYEKGNQFGVKGDIVNTNNWANHDTVKINMENKTLVLAKNGWFSSNSPMTYSLDGWTGRYGMPLEFLLSVHVATMMPDLSYNMATYFDTNVNMYLHRVDGKINVLYKTGQDSEGEDIYVDISKLGNMNDSEKIRWCVSQKILSKDEPAIVIYNQDVYYYEEGYHDGVTGWFDAFPSPINGKYYKAHLTHKDLFDKNGNKVPDDQKSSIDDNVILMTKISNKDKYYMVEKETRPSGKAGAVAYSSYIDEQLPESNRIKTKMLKILNASKNIPKENYETYVPYIADIVKHWYRDVYFIVNTKSEDYRSSALRFVKNDYDYEAIFKERWTLYEVYDKDDISKIDEKYKDLFGEFKLYVISENGIYYRSSKILGIHLLPLPEKLQNNDKIIPDTDDTGLYIYLGTKEDAETEGIIVTKKAVTFGIDEKDTLTDIGWDTLSNNGSIWSAYKPKSGRSSSKSTGGIKEAYTKKQKEEDKNNPYKEDMYVEIKINFDITQEGEGLRTETNPTIKKMFLNNTYFRYDGTERTAEIITALRNKITSSLKASTGKDGIKYGPLNEFYLYYPDKNSLPVTTDVTEYSYNAVQLNLDGYTSMDLDNIKKITDENGKEKYVNTKKDNEEVKIYNVKDYSGQVSINQDSLNAFTMLENTHTLDADYIYRDFKELIVELGYFTKQELTDEIPKLLAFPIPNIGSCNYPERSIDKVEGEYGTLIHSRGDIYADQKLEDQLKESEGYTDEEKKFNSEGGTRTTFREILTDMMGKRIVDEDIDFEELGIDSVTDTGITINQNALINVARAVGAGRKSVGGGKTHSVTTITGETITFKNVIACKNPVTVPARVTLDHYIETLFEMCNYMNEVGYDYCVVHDCITDGCDLDCSVCKDSPTDPNKCIARDKNGNETEMEKSKIFKNRNDYPGCCCAKIQCKHVVLGNYHEHDERNHVTKHGQQGSFFRSLKGDATKGIQYTRNVCCSLLVTWSLQNVGCLGEGQFQTKELYEEWGAEIIEYGEPLKRGDILMYTSHTDVYGGIWEDGRPFKFNGGHPVQKNSTAGTGASSINVFEPDENGWPLPDDLNTPEYAIRLPWLESKEGIYEGYDGNEEVVSPVTGILLEYGTYNSDPNNEDIDSITGEAYRVNVDLKYNASKEILNKEKEENDEIPSEEEPKIVSDSVGYAKILVLDTEYYKNLEQSTDSRWKKESLVTENGKYLEQLIDDDKSLADEKLNSDKDEIRWPDLDQTIYGYKEFAERYEAAGIAGHIVFIDGFICEAPDTKLPTGIGTAQEIPYGDDSTGERRRDNTYHIDGNIDEGISFKAVTQDNFMDEQLKASYVEPKEYKLASLKATNKLIAENQVMAEAASSLYLDSVTSLNGEELIYIKEGTVIGRTMTDRELLMTDQELVASGKDKKIREQDTGTYVENRLFTTGTDLEARDKVIGNYIRVIMRDQDTTPVEDVEDYMKLDDVEIIPDDVLFMAGVITAEAGGLTNKKTGDMRWNTDGAVACALAIKNRLESSKYPNTLAEVLTQEEAYTSVRKDPSKCTGWIYYGELISLKVNDVKYYVSKPSESAIAIAKTIYEGDKNNAYKKIKALVKDRTSWRCFTAGGGDLSDVIRIPKEELTYSNYYGK